jgi:hypothetical protein
MEMLTEPWPINPRLAIRDQLLAKNSLHWAIA